MSHEHQSMVSTNTLSNLAMTISGGLGAWMLMVVAMMFPVLNEQIRHVAFSVQRKRREASIAILLLGYTLIWTVAGVLFSILLPYLSQLLADTFALSNNLIAASAFLLAATLVWLPSRCKTMTACARTMPIRIQGWHTYADSLQFGAKTALVCIRTCWAPMVALMLAHHDTLTMLVVTVLLIYQRYRLPHQSKMLSYAWGMLALGFILVDLL